MKTFALCALVATLALTGVRAGGDHDDHDHARTPFLSIPLFFGC